MEIKDTAAAKLREILKEKGNTGCLRVFMTDGCCGPSVAMDLVPRPEADDVVVSNGDLKVYLNKADEAQLAKAVIDCDKEGDIIITGLPKPAGGCGGDCGCGH